MPKAKYKIKGATDAQPATGTTEAAAGQSLPAPDPNQDTTAGGDTENPPPPDLSKAKVAPKPTPPPVEKVKQVRVIVEGTLGPRLLEKGAITGDPAYVALLNVKGQKKVELVK